MDDFAGGLVNRRIVLARESPFRLGPLVVEPAARRLVHDDGREEILEQRVMQVFVALARAGGGIVARDDLVDSCWDGRVVGDDAINRVIGRLRRCAESVGDGVFKIQTVTKIGYRLVLQTDEPAVPVTPARPGAMARAPAGFWLRHWRLLLVIGFIAVLAASAMTYERFARKAVPTIAIVSEAGEGPPSALGRDLSSDLSRLAGAHAGDLAIVDTNRAVQADYVVRIASALRDGRLSAGLTLVDTGSGELLWSARFDRSAPEQGELREQMAVKLGDVLLCALHDDVGRSELDLVTLRLFLDYCDHIHDSDFESGIDLIREITRRAPGFARGWAYLAMEEASRVEAVFQGDSLATDQVPALRASALEHLSRARAMDPVIGETYLAETFLIPSAGNWGRRLAILDRGIEVAPNAALYDYRSIELMRVGRNAEAAESARRAIALDPLSPWHRNTLVSVLIYSGDVGGARTVLEAAERIWLGSAAMRDMRFRFDLRFGDAAHALQMIDDPAYAMTAGVPEARETQRIFLRARLDPTPARIEAAIAAAQAQSGPSMRNGAALLQILGYFGRVNEAYTLLNQPVLHESRRSGTELLFRPQMRSIRNDRRFIPLAKELGLVDYWWLSGHWPDFCRDPDLPYDCRKEAARLRIRSISKSRASIRGHNT